MRKVLYTVLAVLLLLPVLASFVLSLGKATGPAHSRFAAEPFDYATADFAAYQAWSRERVRAARIGPTQAEVLELLLPFELPPPASCEPGADGKATYGAVLTHGLFESSYAMRALASELNSRCFHVLGLLLPAHGSRPGEFLDTHWEDWAAAVALAAREISSKAETVFLGGHSAGGTLSLLEAAHNPDVDGLILFAPALAITDAARYARYIVPLGRLFPGAGWVSVEEESAQLRYESLTFTAAAEMQGLIDALGAVDSTRLETLPVFTVASMEDTTVKTPAILDFMARNRHPLSHTILYSQFPQEARARVTVVPATDRANGILSLSHLGLALPPDDPWFGRDGRYRSCGHYGNAGNPDFVRCRNGERDWYGETTPGNRESGLLERTAFNPRFDDMLQALERFTQSVVAALSQEMRP